MIRESLEQVRQKAGIGPELRAEVVISVDQGEKLARRTLNPRLGILGGISILGTHGLVKPFSHKAYTATIDSALSIVRAAGIREAVLTTGGKSEKRAMLMRPDLDKVAFVQIADFFAYALRRCAKEGMTRITLVSFFGKAVKQAMGLEYTHAHKRAMDFAQLGGWFQQAGAEAELVEQVRTANTARQVLNMLKEREKQNLISEVGRRMLAQIREFAGPAPEVKAVIIDFEQGILFRDGLEAGE
jgi:cobalt-precorrin-5B (C1)-methyltransferase